MKLSCSTEQLRKGVAKASILTIKNPSLPILANIQISAEKNTLFLRSTDLQVGLEYRITEDLVIEEDGDVIVSASLLNNLLSQFKDSECNLSIDKNEFVITSKHSTTRLKIIQGDDYPTLPRISGDLSFQIETKLFLEGIKNVSYAALHSDIKPEISSVYMYHNGEELVFVATDSFRLAEKKIPQSKINQFSGVLIPVKNCTDISRILNDEEGEVTLLITSNQLSFSNKNLYITSRSIEGIFPDYKQIIPDSFETKVTLLRSDISNLLKMTSIFNDKLKTLNIDINKEESLCVFKSKDPDLGESQAQISSTIEGNSVALMINQRFLVDVIGVIQTDSIQLLFNGTNKPIVVKGIGDSSFFYLIMPMNK